MPPITSAFVTCFTAMTTAVGRNEFGNVATARKGLRDDHPKVVAAIVRLGAVPACIRTSADAVLASLFNEYLAGTVYALALFYAAKHPTPDRNVLAQDVFLKVRRYVSKKPRPGLARPGSLDAFVYVCLENARKDQFKQLKRARRIVSYIELEDTVRYSGLNTKPYYRGPKPAEPGHAPGTASAPLAPRRISINRGKRPSKKSL